MLKNQFESLLEKTPVIAILRGIRPEETETICAALHDVGIYLLEIPLNSPTPLKSIEIASAYCSKHGMMAGAGTVLTPRQVSNVKAAGGTFIISPNVNPAVIQATVQLGLVSVPGFFTATEGFLAIESGAHYLKLFPSTLGPNYIKDLRAVIPAPILAVGGVHKENAGEFLKVCAGLGIGSALYKPGKTPAVLKKDALELLQAIRS